MDIVESLRRAAASANHSDPMRGVLFTCGEAANEIERLRAAMKRAADMLPANAACGVLRAALAHEQFNVQI